MELNADTLKINRSGWYESNKRICDMRDDDRRKRITPDDIFIKENPISDQVARYAPIFHEKPSENVMI